MKVVILARKILKINTRIFKQASSLVNAGYDVTCIGWRSMDTPAYEEKDGYIIHRVAPWQVSLRQRVVALGLSGKNYKGLAAWLYITQRLWYGSRWFSSSMDYYRKAYRVACKLRPDIVHCNDADTLAVGVMLKKRLGCKLVYDMQEFYTGLHTMPGWYSCLMRREEKFLSRYADAITVVNDAIRDYWEQTMGRETTAVILNCPPYTGVSGNGGVRDRLGIEGPLYLFSGGLAPRRGIEQCIEAMQYVDGTLVLLAEGDRSVYESFAELHGLKGRVKFTDFVPHTDVPEFVSSADVGLLPYQDFGLNHHMCSPSKLFHYIMGELPIVATDLPFLSHVIKDNGLGLTGDTSKPEEIADMIRTVMANRAVMRQRSQAVKQTYCWENEERKFLGVYQSL